MAGPSLGMSRRRSWWDQAETATARPVPPPPPMPRYQPQRRNFKTHDGPGILRFRQPFTARATSRTAEGIHGPGPIR